MSGEIKEVALLEVGDKASLSRVVSESDIEDFARITGDFNPVHIDEEYAKNSPFGGRIAHGMLSAGFISAVFAMKLPGPGAVYREQSLRFLAPVKIGETITATVEIQQIDSNKKNAEFKTWCENQDGVVVLEGVAKISLPRKKK